MPGVFSGITIVFLSCTTTITISKYLGEGRYFLIGNLIENEFITNSRWGFGSAISLIMLVLMMIIMFIFDKLSRKWEVRQ
jgi:spermidine/putrescine transport system permease protein